MAKGQSIKAYSPKPKAGGLAGFTSSQMRAQLANLGISPLSNPAKRVAGDVSVRTARTAAEGAPAERYVPDTTRARTELGVATIVEFDDAVTRTVEWFRGRVASTYVDC